VRRAVALRPRTEEGRRWRRSDYPCGGRESTSSPRAAPWRLPLRPVLATSTAVVRSPRAHHASSPPRRREGFHRLRGQDVPPHPSRHGRADLGGALRPALGASGYTYAEAMATQQLHDRIAPVLRLDSSVACHSVLPHRRGLHGALAGFPCAAWQVALGCRFCALL